MKRVLTWVVIVVVAGVTAVALLRDRTETQRSDDPEVNESGHFVSDSLGVSLTLPDAPGWTFRREPPIPGGPYITAVHESDRATVRLFVSPTRASMKFGESIDIRRAQLASGFGVKNLDDIIDKVYRDERQDWAGYPALQWQALSEVMSMDDTPSRIMFGWVATRRPEYVYECLSMVLFPDQPLPEEQANFDALLQQASFIVQSLRLR